MKNDFLPIPPDLMRNPELAILSVLLRTLDITYYSFMAEHPDMHDDTSLFEDPNPPISIIIARNIISQISDLQNAINRYRHRLKQEHEAKYKDIPF